VARLLAGICLMFLSAFSQNAVGETPALDASVWIGTQFPEAKLRHPGRIARLVFDHAAVNDLPFNLLLAVIAVESRFKSDAHSEHGAIGLTQVLPKYHHDKLRGRPLTSPDVAIEVGAIILGNCLARWKKMDRALRCYSGSSGKHAVEYVGLVERRIRQFMAFQMMQESHRLRFAQVSNEVTIASTYGNLPN